MPYCENCGEEISERQYNNFSGLCPACKRREDGIPIYPYGMHKEDMEKYQQRFMHSPFHFLIQIIVRFLFIIWGVTIIGFGIAAYPHYIQYISWESQFHWSGNALVPVAFVVGPILVGIGIYVNIRAYLEKK